MDLLLTEELLLLGLDAESGRPSWTFDASMLDAAVLLDLVRTGCVRLDDERVLVTEPVSEHPLLRAAQEIIAGDPTARKVPYWHSTLPYELGGVPKRAAERLVAEGVLVEQERTVLGLFRSARFPESDPGPEHALRERLHRVLVAGDEPDEHDTLLVMLLASGYGVHHVFAGDDEGTRRTAGRRATELATAAREDPVFQARQDAAVIAAVTTVVVSAVVVSGGDGGGGGGGG